MTISSILWDCTSQWTVWYRFTEGAIYAPGWHVHPRMLISFDEAEAEASRITSGFSEIEEVRICPYGTWEPP